MHTEKAWLNSFSWKTVEEINQSFCTQQKTAFQISAKNYDAARQIWEKAVAQPLSLEDVLDLCRRCYEMAPFTFNNGNTFASIAKSLIDDWITSLPSVERQIVRNTIGHYVASIVSKKELRKVMRHFETSWNTYAAARKVAPITIPLNVPQPQQQAQSS